MIITGECTLITKIAMLVVSSGTMVANSLYIVFRCSRSEWLTGMPICILSLLSFATMLQIFSNCEVKAAQCGNFTILLPLKFYVKSNFGELSRSKM